MLFQESYELMDYIIYAYTQYAADNPSLSLQVISREVLVETQRQG